MEIELNFGLYNLGNIIIFLKYFFIYKIFLYLEKKQRITYYNCKIWYLWLLFLTIIIFMLSDAWSFTWSINRLEILYDFFAYAAMLSTRYKSYFFNFYNFLYYILISYFPYQLRNQRFAMLTSADLKCKLYTLPMLHLIQSDMRHKSIAKSKY